jgi:hypothetical protein
MLDEAGMSQKPVHTAAMFSLAIALATPHSAQSKDSVVKIETGAIEGAASGDVWSFKGIPYAAPPVGPLRWRAPQPVTPWNDVRPATAYGDDCMQKPIPGNAAASGGEFGEDCLYVSVCAIERQPAAAWLDQSKPDSWNKPGLSIPAAPKIQGTVDPKCKESARPPELEEDKRLRDQGWDLVGGYQGGWQILVIRGTAGYDGMCRSRQYQDFVFVRGQFAGTLAPQPMDSRADGALSLVSLQSGSRLIAEYQRYAATDPLCCTPRTTRVVFELASDTPIVRPASTFTTATHVPSSGGTQGADGRRRHLRV